MPHNNPDLLSLGIAAVAALLGGLARWWENKMFCKPFNYVAFFIDMTITAGIGVLTFWMIVDLGQPESFAAAGSAIAGNFGSRAFEISRSVVSKKIGGDK